MASVGELAHKAFRRIETGFDPGGLTVPFITMPAYRPEIDPAGTGLIYDMTVGSLLEWAGAWWVKPGTTDPIETVTFLQVPPRFDGVPRAGQPIICIPGTWAGSPAPSIQITWFVEGEEPSKFWGNTTSQFGRNAEELAAMQAGRKIRCSFGARQTLASGAGIYRSAEASAYVQPALTGGA